MTEHAITVLFVEDDESLRRIVARYLRSKGYGVHESESAEDAAAELDAGLRPEVVVLDLNLPGDTGWDLLRGAAFASAGSPRVLITSAVSVSPQRLAAFAVDGFLPKPFALETLQATIDRLLLDEGAQGEP